ncbi:MAG: hypothetical protein JHC38_04380, partial [Thiotrichales bacterium]|nr:hypothetical protein [Thiotrichales bacterium]
MMFDQKTKKIAGTIVAATAIIIGGLGFYVAGSVEKEAVKQAKKIDYFNFKSASASWFGRSVTFKGVSIGGKGIELQSVIVSDYGLVTSKDDVKNISRLTLTFNGIQTSNAYMGDDGLISVSLSLQKGDDDGAVLSAGFNADNIDAVIKLNTDESVKSVMR